MTQTADRNLYAVQVLKDRYLCVRSVDLAHYLGISKASVSTFIRQMRQQGLIEVEPDGNLLLTEKGPYPGHPPGHRPRRRAGQAAPRKADYVYTL